MKIFIEAPYQKLVDHEQRFWNASGIDLTLNASGLSVNTQTLASVLAGGMAFESPPERRARRRRPRTPSSRCSTTAARRWRRPTASPVPIRMVFDQSVRGLAAGRGDRPARRRDRPRAASSPCSTTRRRSASRSRSSAEIYPLRLGPVREALLRDAERRRRRRRPAAARRQRPARAAAHRQPAHRPALRRARLHSRPAAHRVGRRRRRGAHADRAGHAERAAAADRRDRPEGEQDPVRRHRPRPAHDAAAARARRSASSRPRRRRRSPKCRRTLSSAQKSLENLDRNVTDPNAPVQRNLEETLLELQRTSRALRVLSDYLQQHPESLLRGKPADAPVPQPLESVTPCATSLALPHRRGSLMALRGAQPARRSCWRPAAPRRRPTSTA